VRNIEQFGIRRQWVRPANIGTRRASSKRIYQSFLRAQKALDCPIALTAFAARFAHLLVLEGEIENHNPILIFTAALLSPFRGKSLAQQPTNPPTISLSFGWRQ
jgi:hypothetical protein